MAKTELSQHKFLEYLEKEVPTIEEAEKVSFSDHGFFSIPNPDPLEDILNQRQGHRRWIMILASIILLVPLLVIFGAMIVQICYRMYYSDTFKIFDTYELEVLAVTMFGSAIGIFKIITKSLWDDTPYKDFLAKKINREIETKNN